MTEDEAEVVRERQTETRIESKLTSKLENRIETQGLVTKVQGEIDRYIAAVPEITDGGSAQNARVVAEFDHLVSLGQDPKDLRTQAMAIRSAFGSIESLESAKAAKPRDGHQEIGGGADPDPPGDKDGADKNMPAGNRRYYQDLITRGFIKDWAAANAKFNYKGKHAPTRH